MAVPTGLMPDQLELFLEGPALSPPPNVKSNFDNPYTFGSAVFIDEIIFLILPTLAIMMLVYTKLRIVRKREPEDYFVILAWGIYVANVGTALVRGYPVGRHQWDVKFKDLKQWMYYIHISAVMYRPMCFLIKLSILLQYIRILSSKQRSLFFWACHALICVHFAFYTVCFFLTVFSCKPIAKAWDPSVSGTCLDYLTLNTIFTAFDAGSNFIIFLLPQPLIWRLHMSFRRRLGVSLILAVGLLACGAAIMRLFYSIKHAHSDDDTWYISLMGSFVFPELGLGIVIVCLPSVPEFWKSFLSFGSTTSTSHLRNLKGGEQQYKRGKNRRDSFNRLVDDYELNSSLRKDNTAITREMEVPIIPRGKQIVRTVHVQTVSQQQPETGTPILFGLNHQGRPWEGTHEHKVTVSR